MTVLIAVAALAWQDVTLEGVPYVVQRPDFCGEACAEMALAWRGSPLDQDDVFALTGLDPALGRGAWTRELVVGLRQTGFDPDPTWTTVRAGAAADVRAQWAALHGDLLDGIPTIVCVRTDGSARATEHFLLVLGYRDGDVVFHDPAETDGAYQTMPLPTFLSQWPLRYDAATWTLIRMPLRADAVRDALPPDADPRAADLAQHLRGLELPDGFHVVISSPFVVIGNGSRERVERHAAGTVAWTARRLREAYFDRDPEDIWEIWLMKDGPSYRRVARQRFGAVPDTPYGFALSGDNALVMNIATGGGTLVHEMVHPYIQANFPEAPAWFDEGLASLYEQSTERDGRIVGLTNWRLAGLQEAIRAGTVPRFQALMGTSRNAFYNRDPGTHYAQARYLLFHLQEEGLLRRYYSLYRANVATDPTGVETLRTVLGTRDLAGFQVGWERWVAALSYP